MTDASRTILASRLVVLATTASLFFAGTTLAQTAPSTTPAPTAQAPAAPMAPAPGTIGTRHGPRGEAGGHHFKRMDTDGDGAVSRAEFDAAGQRMNEQRNRFFEMADSNKDGKLSSEEMQAFRQTHRRGPHRDPGAR
jgi:EF-hand domain pair